MVRIASIVIALHLLILIKFQVGPPTVIPHKRPMEIKTTFHTCQKKKEVTQETTSSKRRPISNNQKNKKNIGTSKKVSKKQRSNPSASPKKIEIPKHLSKKLQESIAKIEGKSDKVCTRSYLESPKSIPKLEIEGSEADHASYVEALVSYLKTELTLPEIGEVKIELLIENIGTLKKYRVISSKSPRNQHHLENELTSLKFPRFTGNLISKKECTFVISFSNF